MMSNFNCRSKMTALKGSLSDFAAQIEEPLSNTSAAVNVVVSESVCHDFLEQQQARIRLLEENLLQATEEILPSTNTTSNSRRSTTTPMTVTEAAHCIRMLQQLQLRQMQRLELAMQQYFLGSSSNSAETEHNLNNFSSSMMMMMTHDPLDAVVETDNETDYSSGTTPGGNTRTLTTPGTTATSSSASRRTAAARTPGSSLPTPTLHDLQLSESTVSMMIQLDTTTTTTTPTTCQQASPLVHISASINDDNVNDKYYNPRQQSSPRRCRSITALEGHDGKDDASSLSPAAAAAVVHHETALEKKEEGAAYYRDHHHHNRQSFDNADTDHNDNNFVASRSSSSSSQKEELSRRPNSAAEAATLNDDVALPCAAGHEGAIKDFQEEESFRRRHHQSIRNSINSAHPSDEATCETNLNSTHPSDEGGWDLFFNDDDDDDESNAVSTVIQTKVPVFRKQQRQQSKKHQENEDCKDASTILEPYEQQTASVADNISYAKKDADYYYNDEDDSAPCAATIKARKDRTIRIIERSDNSSSVHHHLPPPSSPSNISSIQVDTDAPSPAGTNITFDDGDDDNYGNDTTLNETFGQLLTTVIEEEDNDAMSTETPVLDRYRLDHDDTSPHGFVVVPNQRGLRRRRRPHKQQNMGTLLPTNSSRKSQQQQQQQQHKKIYRKTPRPSKQKLPSTPVIDENACMDLSETSYLCSNNSSSPAVSVEKTMTTITTEQVERNKPSSISAEEYWSQQRLSLAEKQGGGRSSSLPPSLLYARANLARLSHDGTSLTSTPPPKRDTTIDSIAIKSPPPRSKERSAVQQQTTAQSREDGSSASPCASNNKEQFCPFIRTISQDEYNSAPRIVHLHVSFDEVTSAIDALNDAIRQAVSDINVPQNIAHGVHVAESEAHLIFQAFGFDDSRKRKSLLFALCSFRRLLMRRPSSSHGYDDDDDKNNDMIFDVVGV